MYISYIIPYPILLEGSFMRVPTGIPGFDELIKGGFIVDDVILLAGGPGAGIVIDPRGSLLGQKGDVFRSTPQKKEHIDEFC